MSLLGEQILFYQYIFFERIFLNCKIFLKSLAECVCSNARLQNSEDGPGNSRYLNVFHYISANVSMPVDTLPGGGGVPKHYF